MIIELLKDAENRMRGAIASLGDDLGGFRTGRASPQLVERLPVEMYGTEMELRQMAVISIPEPQQIAIRPYDANSISVKQAGGKTYRRGQGCCAKRAPRYPQRFTRI